MWFSCCDAQAQVNTDAEIDLLEVQEVAKFRREGSLKANDGKQLKEAEPPKTKTVVDIDEVKLSAFECDTSTIAWYTRLVEAIHDCFPYSSVLPSRAKWAVREPPRKPSSHANTDGGLLIKAEPTKTKMIVDIDEVKLSDLDCDTSTTASQSLAGDAFERDSCSSTLSDSTEEAKFALVEDIYLTGPWSSWKTNSEDGLLQAVPTTSTTTGLLKLCVRLTSQSFSFQVITDRLKWDWHLYPKHAKAIQIGFIKSHVSREGFLRAGSKDAIIGLGDQTLGHGINFHVVEKPGTVVTVWVEVPTKPAGSEGLSLRTDTTDGARIWYTVEDTGVQCVAGDGINLDRYKRYLPADMKLE